MIQTPHPDALSDYHAFKAIKRGSKQAADDRAMEAMWQALEAGASKEEVEKVFFDTYKNVKDGK
jgi:hypothetical protein